MQLVLEGPPEHRAAHLVPEDAEWYLSVYLSPSSAQKRAIETVSGVVEDPAETARSLAAGLLQRFGVSYDEIEPWLGREMAVFKLPFRGKALLLELKNGSDAAGSEVADRIEGVAFRAGFAVVGDGDAVAAVGQGTSLADSHAWTVVQAVEDRVLAGFSTGDESFYELLYNMDVPVIAARLMEGLSHWWLSLDSGRVVIDGFSDSDGAFLLSDTAPPEMEELPVDSWLASEIPNLDHTVEALVGMLEARWGRAGAVLEVTSPLLDAVDGARLALGGANVFGSWVQLDAAVDDDRSARRRTKAMLAKAPRWGLAVAEGERTWTIDAGAPLGSITISVDDSLRVGRGAPASEPLATSERYLEAKDWLDGIEPRLYVDLPRMSDAVGLLADTFLPPPGLSGLDNRVDRVVLGVERHASGIASRIVIELIPTEESSD